MSLDSLPNEKPTRWAIVGGGMLGLTAALELKQRGEEVTIIEAAAELGGLTSAWAIGGVVWDKYYHVTLLSDTAARKLLEDLGLEKEIEWVQTRTGFYSNGRLHSLSSSLEFLKFPILNLYQKFRLGGTIFLASKIRNWRAMEQISVESWLRKWSGNSVFQKIWLPLLRSKLGDAYKRTSAAFIWAYIDRMYKARRSGMKREMFGYVPGGYFRILNAIADKLRGMNIEVLTNTRVTQVVRNDATGKLGVASETNGSERQFEFDRVLMTTHCGHIASVCAGLSPTERQSLQEVEYLGVICTSLLLQKPLGGYYVTNITDDGIPITGVIEMGSILPPEKLSGHYLVYLPQYMSSDDSRFDETDEVIHDRCLTTLERMYPDFSRKQVKAIQTARARNVMAIPTLNYSVKRAPLVSSVAGLYLLNSARIVQGTLNVNETIELMHSELEQVVWPDHLGHKNPVDAH